MRLILILPLLLAGTAAAADCPPAPDHRAALDAVLAQLREAPDEAAAAELNARAWELWTDAPDAVAQEMLDRGMALREIYAFAEARAVFDELVDYCPRWAESHNQRAFAAFLQQDYAAALTDLDRALEIDPRHVGALSGKALTLMGLGREAEGREVLRAALDLNPWLAERALLGPEL